MNVDVGRRTMDWARVHPWMLVVRGIVAILFGILALVWPGITVGVLLVLFGIYALADGILAIAAAVGTSEGRKRWWALLLIGLVSILAGIITFSYPGITLLALLYIIAAWAVINGILHVVQAFTGTGDVGPRWLWGLSGAFTLLFGILLFAYPVVGILAVVWLIGFYALIFGLMLIVIGIQFWGYGRQFRGALQH